MALKEFSEETENIIIMQRRGARDGYAFSVPFDLLAIVRQVDMNLSVLEAAAKRTGGTSWAKHELQIEVARCRMFGQLAKAVNESHHDSGFPPSKRGCKRSRRGTKPKYKC